MPESELDSPTSDDRRIFAIFSGPIQVGHDGQSIQRILIFDNHPATLRLLMDSREALRSDKAPTRLAKLGFAAGAIALVVISVLAVLWPLW